MLFLCIVLISVLVLFGIVLLYLYIKNVRKSKNRDNFFYHAIHEMKNPLSTITLTSEMLYEMDSLDDNAHKLAKMIIVENRRVAQAVDLFLHFAKIEKDELIIHKELVDVHALLNESLMIYEFLLEKENGVLTKSFNASKYMIKGDKMHLTNVFDNLLDNGQKYSERPAEVAVTTRNEDKYLIVSVSDKGIGIDYSFQKHVFKQFYRVKKKDNISIKGFGMGLYYVKYVIEKHGGRIDLKSKPGEGSCFDIYLPLKDDSS